MRIVSTFLLALLVTLPAHAAEWGVLVIQKDVSALRIEDFVAAVGAVAKLNAPLNVTLQTWAELETGPNRYVSEQKLGGFNYARAQGLSISYFGISPINTVKRDMPADLMALKWDDPALLARFAQLLEATAPHLPSDLPTFVIGNEVDSYFAQHLDEVTPYLTFFAHAKALVKQRWPHAQVGMSVTFEGLHKGRTALVQQLIAASDAAFFTFYPVFDFTPVAPAATPALLDEMLHAAGGKDVYLQEVGYASNPALGSSPAQQAAFFSTIMPAIEARPRIKAASIFALHDFDAKACASFASYYGADDWGHFTAPFKAFLCSLGIRNADGTTKPAWDIIAKQLAKL